MKTAKLIIEYLGGYKKVADIVNRNVIVIRKWAYPFEKREGKGGIIPAKYQIVLLNYAREHGIDLRPEDFFYPERLQLLMQEQRPPLSNICKSRVVDPTGETLQP